MWDRRRDLRRFAFRAAMLAILPTLNWPARAAAPSFASVEVIQDLDACALHLAQNGGDFKAKRRIDGRVELRLSVWLVGSVSSTPLDIEIDSKRFGPTAVTVENDEYSLRLTALTSADLLEALRTATAAKVSQGRTQLVHFKGREPFGGSLATCEAKHDALIRRFDTAIATRNVRPQPILFVNLAGDGDYPEVARREMQEGKAILQVTVGTDGFISDCHLMQGTGFAALDGKSCKVAQTRIRFLPATDRSGVPIPKSMNYTLNWSLDRLNDPDGSAIPQP